MSGNGWQALFILFAVGGAPFLLGYLQTLLDNRKDQR